MDREKVIKKLAVRIQSDSEGWNTIELPIEEAKDILAMLKEQQSEILDFIESVARLTVENEILKKDNLAKYVLHEHQVNDHLRKQLANRPEIVRCKYCKHRSEEMYDYYGNPNNKVYVCQIHDLATKPDWFCADWKRKEAR